MARKYRYDLFVIRPLLAVQAALRRGRPPTRLVVLAITPDVPGTWRSGER